MVQLWPEFLDDVGKRKADYEQLARLMSSLSIYLAPVTYYCMSNCLLDPSIVFRNCN